jgi:hypothetical protein
MVQAANVLGNLRRLAAAWYQRTLVDLVHQLRWTFLPPLMVYFAAGISGLTAIVGTFFVKEYLSLSAAFLASLAFWAGVPWTLKIPLGHLVDIMWRWKFLLVYAGAALISASLLIMYGLIAHTSMMRAVAPVEVWFVISALLAPSGYVVQDTVADAMSVEAVPKIEADGRRLSDDETKALHTTMQTLGRFALISGFVFVAAINIILFDGVEGMAQEQKADVYARVYQMALIIPVVSISGVILSQIFQRQRARQLRNAGLSDEEIDTLIYAPSDPTTPSMLIFGAGLAYVTLTFAVGLSGMAYAQEIVFVTSMAIVVTLIWKLIERLPEDSARTLVGTAVIIFVFRAVPLPGEGATWFTIDRLGFDQQFLAVLSLIASVLTLAGMIVLRPLMANHTIAYIVVVLTLAAGVLSLPNIGLYYGVHEWTAAMTGGVVDARFIAIVNTTLESPLGQIAMIPMLAWIARNAPADLKATFFAVMASFTNLALSASSLLTKYLNQIFTVTREARSPETGVVVAAADYSELGVLLITVAVIGLLLPLLTVFLVQRSRLATRE